MLAIRVSTMKWWLLEPTTRLATLALSEAETWPKEPKIRDREPAQKAEAPRLIQAQVNTAAPTTISGRPSRRVSKSPPRANTIR